MASYGEWNKSIAAYFTAGIAKGSPVFLTVDEDSLFEIAQYFMEGSVDDDPVNDFFKAIRQKCVVSHTISISAIKGSDSEGIPNCVAFLGALVFAAYKMQQEEDVGVTNYFLRLREVLFDPPFGQGRPEGFPVGCEAGLWKAWNIYLVNLGFRTTAEEGAGPHKFIYYALSQPILRECDKRLLRIFFNEAQLPNFDCERLGYWLSRKQINQQHLREGFHHPDSGRLWEFYRAAHRVYESEDWKNTENQSKRKEKTINKLQCGLYLVEDRGTGESQYLIFPQQPRGMRFATLSVEQEKDVHRKLRPLKGGFFYPLWEQTPFVDNPQLFSVKGNQNIQHMVFPKRDYWILMRDPDESEFGAWASWKPTPDLGERFILLSREGAFDDEMRRLRSSKLIDWAERNVHNGFIEFVDCMVCSFDVKWHTPASAECSDLVDALT
ncbi:MAG: hypothetical protein EOM12_14645, partial [Verrucomicrobiae bacterium]|nr:hypothetical protein [Verrucomicrobiae bacterium]